MDYIELSCASTESSPIFCFPEGVPSSAISTLNGSILLGGFAKIHVVRIRTSSRFEYYDFDIISKKWYRESGEEVSIDEIIEKIILKEAIGDWFI